MGYYYIYILIINKILDKNICKLTGIFNLIADENGIIDIDCIVNEMYNNVMTAKPFIVKTEFMGDIEIGEGTIKLNIPLTDKRLVLNREDLIVFKDTLVNNNQGCY